MTWEESEALFKRLTKEYNAASPTQYGYFTEWWFNYGWSVGGDCMQYDPVNKKYIFTLGDDKPNYRVKEDFEGTMQVGESSYKAGEIIGYWDRDKLTEEQKAQCYQLPSQYEAFEKFVMLSQPKGSHGGKGLGITPSPNTVGSDSTVTYFTSQKVASFVGGRYIVPQLRDRVDNFSWDVAPLPKYSQGVEAGCSDSVGMCVWSNSKKKEAAFKFIEFISGPKGQKIAAESGFSIPNQMEMAFSDVFLKSPEGTSPQNSIVFARAAQHQTKGDWAYLSDSGWIEEWAPTLNGPVRNGEMDLTTFFNQVTKKTNDRLAIYTRG